MEHDKKLIEKIAIDVQTEYQMGGLAEGLYLDFAIDVAIRYANAVSKQADVLELIKLAGKIINGDDKKLGIAQCVDSYYIGVWDDDLSKFDNLISEIGNGR